MIMQVLCDREPSFNHPSGSLISSRLGLEKSAGPLHRDGSHAFRGVVWGMNFGCSTGRFDTGGAGCLFLHVGGSIVMTLPTGVAWCGSIYNKTW